jgi:hypothetical protein
MHSSLCVILSSRKMLANVALPMCLCGVIGSDCGECVDIDNLGGQGSFSVAVMLSVKLSVCCRCLPRMSEC